MLFCILLYTCLHQDYQQMEVLYESAGDNHTDTDNIVIGAHRKLCIQRAGWHSGCWYLSCSLWCFCHMQFVTPRMLIVGAQIPSISIISIINREISSLEALPFRTCFRSKIFPTEILLSLNLSGLNKYFPLVIIFVQVILLNKSIMWYGLHCSCVCSNFYFSNLSQIPSLHLHFQLLAVYGIETWIFATKAI